MLAASYFARKRPDLVGVCWRGGEVMSEKKKRKLTAQQRLKLRKEKARAWRQAHPEAFKKWKVEHREGYL